LFKFKFYKLLYVCVYVCVYLCGTLIDIDHYYETSSYKAKKNQQNPKWGKYKSVSHGHGYSTHGAEKS
jgi:hypothetical protein